MSNFFDIFKHSFYPIKTNASEVFHANTTSKLISLFAVLINTKILKIYNSSWPNLLNFRIHESLMVIDNVSLYTISQIYDILLIYHQLCTIRKMPLMKFFDSNCRELTIRYNFGKLYLHRTGKRKEKCFCLDILNEEKSFKYKLREHLSYFNNQLQESNNV